jgi:hypothetical protein
MKTPMQTASGHRTLEKRHKYAKYIYSIACHQGALFVFVAPSRMKA